MDCSEIVTRLKQARDAYHELMTTGAVTRFIDQNGESVSYSKADPRGLLGYITRLEAQLATCSSGGVGAYRGPLKFTFGRRVC